MSLGQKVRVRHTHNSTCGWRGLDGAVGCFDGLGRSETVRKEQPMRAITIDHYGTRPRLQDIPKPPAREGEVLIRLRAADYDEATWRATIARLAAGAAPASQQEQAS